MKTYAPIPDDIERRWFVVDANGVVLGRLASEVAKILRGKHKPIFAPHADVGDHVIVVNAKGVRLTGGKETKKVAYRHSGYPGGLTETPYGVMLERRPRFVVEKAVKGMLPKNSLGRAMAGKLQVYEGPEHPHQAQKPELLTLGEAPRWEGLPEPKPRPEPEPKAKSKPPPRARKPATRRAAAAPPAKKAAAKKSEAKRATAKRSTARPAAAEESHTAKKPAAKKSATRRSRKPRKPKEE